MHRLRLSFGPALAGAGLLAALASTPARADPETCASLWTSRNEIYKAQGYCFRTQRAISAFGNAGCQYDNIEDVPLSANDRRAIADIVRQERALRCPR
ncbi:YARHG domain-containing protein [Bosea thiooxidans]|nr:YARHG domain-containing protein [Bosea sp. (in: a-proteobacteria)]